MSKLIAARTAQNVVEAEFTFNFDDTMVSVAGSEVDFGKTNISATSFDIIPLPAGATILFGEVVRTTAFDTASYAVTVGDATTADRYLASTDLKAAGHTALVPTGFVSTGEKVRIGITNADVCTTGVCTVRIGYVVAGKADIVQIK
jgi:hypothetical protein